MFTYNIQLAGYDYSQYDEKGIISYEDFIEVVEQFPWAEQVKKYEDTQTGCSATIAVTNTITNNVLWISVKGTSKKYDFLIGYVYPKTVKPFLGIGKEKIKRWVDIYVVNHLTIAYKCSDYFFKNHLEQLNEALFMEEKFKSMIEYTQK
jgi:hypothetical protein